MNTFRMFSRVLVVAAVVCAGNMSAEFDGGFEGAVNGVVNGVAHIVTNPQIQGMAAGVTAAGVVKYGYDEAQAISQDGVDKHSLLIGMVLGGVVGAYTGNVKAGLVAGAATVGTIKLVSATKDTELSRNIQAKLGKVAQSSAAQVGVLVAVNAVGAVVVNQRNKVSVK